jgi:hypothetical protein
MIPCLSKTLFGVECLGCGFQRSLLLLLRGDFTAAFQMYPAIFTTLLFGAILGFHYFDKTRNYKKLILSMAVLNGLFMTIGYAYKHF